jgi:hypothetical protein
MGCGYRYAQKYLWVTCAFVYTYHKESSSKLKHVIKGGMTGMIIDLFTCNKTEAIETQLKSDLEEFAIHGLCMLVVAYEELNGDDPKAEGSRFKFIGLLCILQSSSHLPCSLVCHCICWPN